MRVVRGALLLPPNTAGPTPEGSPTEEGLELSLQQVALPRHQQLEVLQTSVDQLRAVPSKEG